MKRFFRLLLCASLVLSLTSCDTWWGLLVAGITGKGYYSVSYSSVATAYASGYLKQDSIDLLSLTTSSVIVYRTNSPYYLYGKLVLTSAATASSITIQYETWSDSSGSTASSSNGKTITANSSGIDLRSGGYSSTTADFTFDGTKLVPNPTYGAVFYLYSQ